MSKKYSIGIDYGSESGRAVLVSLEDGTEIADCVTNYSDGVIDTTLPNSSTKLGHEWSLQNPADYLKVLQESVPAIIKKSNVSPRDIISIGIDFTSCTIMPTNQHGMPLCFHPRWRDNPHSWVKLWKHHAAHNYAKKVNDLAAKRNEPFLTNYDGTISSEWMLPKIYQILDESPELYDEAHFFIEAVDWIVFQLTGNLMRNSCAAGYKSLWQKEGGYPSTSFFKALDPRLENLVHTKLKGKVVPPGTNAGYLTMEMAEVLGLSTQTVVAVGTIDAHASVLGSRVNSPNKMVLTMGTSLCQILISEKKVQVEGMAGVVLDGIIPGYYGYEAGQPAVGDIFAWFVENSIPTDVKDNAIKDGISVHEWLEKKASNYSPGESGLIALDWWNGNRSTLVNDNLSGIILGLSLETKPEEIYRALMEATAFGTKKVIKAFEHSGLNIEEVYACGGLPQKNKLLMQIFADVTNCNIKIAASKQTSALGAAILGSVAAGSNCGGYDSIADATNKMAKIKEAVIQPIPENVMIYEKLFEEYSRLYDYFGRGENDVMNKLKSIRNEVTNRMKEKVKI